MEDRMRQLVDGYFRALRLFIVVCLAGMVVLVFGNVVLRYVFNTGITISEEASRWLFVWMTFVGAIIALRKHAHLGMDSLVSRLPTAAKKACFLASNLLMLYALWLFLYGSWQQTLINLDNRAPATGLSSGWYYGVGIFFSIAAGLLVLRNISAVVAGRIEEKDLIQVQESEDMQHVLHPRSPIASGASPLRETKR
jgi:TRAP-type C4-dicarboxylate transport system permease small subunit